MKILNHLALGMFTGIHQEIIAGKSPVFHIVLLSLPEIADKQSDHMAADGGRHLTSSVIAQFRCHSSPSHCTAIVINLYFLFILSNGAVITK